MKSSEFKLIIPPNSPRSSEWQPDEIIYDAVGIKSKAVDHAFLQSCKDLTARLETAYSETSDKRLKNQIKRVIRFMRECEEFGTCWVEQVDFFQQNQHQYNLLAQLYLELFEDYSENIEEIDQLARYTVLDKLITVEMNTSLDISYASLVRKTEAAIKTAESQGNPFINYYILMQMALQIEKDDFTHELQIGESTYSIAQIFSEFFTSNNRSRLQFLIKLSSTINDTFNADPENNAQSIDVWHYLSDLMVSIPQYWPSIEEDYQKVQANYPALLPKKPRSANWPIEIFNAQSQQIKRLARYLEKKDLSDKEVEELQLFAELFHSVLSLGMISAQQLLFCGVTSYNHLKLISRILSFSQHRGLLKEQFDRDKLLELLSLAATIYPDSSIDAEDDLMTQADNQIENDEKLKETKLDKTASAQLFQLAANMGVDVCLDPNKYKIGDWSANQVNLLPHDSYLIFEILYPECRFSLEIDEHGNTDWNLLTPLVFTNEPSMIAAVNSLIKIAAEEVKQKLETKKTVTIETKTKKQRKNNKKRKNRPKKYSNNDSSNNHPQNIIEQLGFVGIQCSITNTTAELNELIDQTPSITEQTDLLPEFLGNLRSHQLKKIKHTMVENLFEVRFNRKFRILLIEEGSEKGMRRFKIAAICHRRDLKATISSISNSSQY